ncbi:MAG: YgjV family protein [Oscillospiraceae bacterium]|nr:YgjV family protein [Oscillospiraceae bacterium]
MNSFLIQAIGFVGVGLFILSYQIKSNRALFFCQMLGCVIFCVQFFLLGAYTGAVSLFINILRNVLLLKSNVWPWARSRGTLAVLLLLLALTTVFTWAGWISLLPFVSMAVSTIGYWTQNGQKIRLSQLIGSPCTLLYDALIHSWGGALNEGIAIVSILISIYRFGWKALAEETS